MNYKCVVFDFDGTLADTEAIVFDIYNKMASKYHYSPINREQLGHIKEMHIQEIFSLIEIPWHKLPRVIRDGQKQLHRETENIYAFDPDIHRFMVTLRQHVPHAGILTSNINATVRHFLTRYQLDDLIDFVFCSSLLSKERKIRKVLKKYHLKKEELLYVGDETRDIEACHRAGVDVAAVSWGYNTSAALDRCHPTYTIQTLNDLITILLQTEDDTRS